MFPRIAVAGLLAIAIVFIALNRRAYDGFFQDDSISTLAWAHAVRFPEYVAGFLKPVFDPDNFRPTGHLYYTLMSRAFGLDFPPYITPLFAFHMINGLLVYLLARKLGIGAWAALAGAAFFTLSASAFDAWWKPMYVFDLTCATFCLTCILLYAHGRWVLSFVAFWLAYKAKELAVTLPAVLLLYEYWFGRRRYAALIPFFIASLSFGLQGILLNPNKDNEYTFRFTPQALATTIPFYAQRFLALPFSGFVLLALLPLRDRRIWFGLAASVLFLFTLLFLPGRLFQAYGYLPLSGVALALAAAASRFRPVWACAVLAIWLPWNIHVLRTETRTKLARDDEAAEFVDQILRWSSHHPEVTTLIYSYEPGGYHHWGVEGAWDIAHSSIGLPVFYVDTPGAKRALAEHTVAVSEWTWNGHSGRLTIQIHLPSH